MNGTQPASVLIARASRMLLLTCSADGRCHRVTDERMAAGLRTRTGRYRAVCGHTVPATPMLTPDGHSCPNCTVAVAPHPNDRPRRSGRHRRPRLLRRLLARNGPTPPAGGPESTPSSSGSPASHPGQPLQVGS